ncbi:MAG: TetR/AcrR family transcriptional regulator [Burkholderiales bacterium]|nr:TetR/AcrR family transcriptional regulator [Burkholderiales bacterium]
MSTQTVPAEPRWQRRKQARPGELLEAALAIFTERGYIGTRLEDVAARAGVSKGTLYLYFANKEELFKAVVRQGLVTPLEEMRDKVETFDGSAADMLRLVVRGWWLRIGATAHAGSPKLMIAEAANFPEIARFYIEEVLLPVHQTLARLVERGVARGEFRPVDAGQVAHLIAAPFLVISAWRHGFGHAIPDRLPALTDAPALLETHLDLLLRGLAPVPAGPAGH